jgi:hypothetical protein
MFVREIGVQIPESRIYLDLESGIWNLNSEI